MRIAKVVFVLAILSLPAFSATIFAFSGNFTQDDYEAQYSFTILTSVSVNLQTWSYAGGTDPLSNVIPSGGFAPVLSLFDAGGNLLGYDAGGSAPSGCGPRAIDSDGFCLDAYLLEPLLNAGTYFVTLTEQDNTPNGPTLADGFARDGQGNFTGPEFLGVPGSFIDQGLNQRDSAYEFTIGPVNTAFVVPEPSGTLMLVPGLLWLWRVKRRKNPIQKES
jgi:hypothetical protein